MKKEKNFQVYFIIILLYLCTLCGCKSDLVEDSATKEEVKVEEKYVYSESELAFIEDYKKLREGTVKIEKVVLPSDNPQTTDFAVVPLEEEFFQTPAFSFLPIDNRNLTDIELQQLYSYYGDIEAEKILKKMHQYKETASKEQIENCLMQSNFC